MTHEDSRLSFKIHGFVSNANYSMKKSVFLLFINREFTSYLYIISSDKIEKVLQVLNTVTKLAL